MPLTTVIRVVALAILASSCHSPAPPAAIDPELSSRVPASTVALACVHLDQLRASPLYTKLPAAATAFLETFRGARSVLIASNGVELLTIARGSLPGAKQVAPDLALLGSPALIAAATAPHPPAAILAAAESVAAESIAAHYAVWIAVRGGAPLPLDGNLANVNNLVRAARYLTLSVRLSDVIDFELTARCPSPGAALQFEQRLRALISLTAAANTRHPEIATLLHGLNLRRDDRIVHATLSALPGTLALFIAR